VQCHNCGQTYTQPQRTEQKTIKEQPDFSCDSCGNIPDEEGWLQHGRGCYTQSEDGGGYEYISRADQKNPEFEAQPAPVQEPFFKFRECEDSQAGIVTPPQRTWVGLTPEEFHEACWESYVDPVTGECSTGDREYAVRWTEAKLKQKNGFAEENT
jgi:hypothetical protein